MKGNHKISDPVLIMPIKNVVEISVIEWLDPNKFTVLSHERIIGTYINAESTRDTPMM
jgi:RNA-binding protein YlmH